MLGSGLAFHCRERLPAAEAGQIELRSERRQQLRKRAKFGFKAIITACYYKL